MSRTALASETRNLSGFCRSIQSRNWLWGVLLIALVLVAYARVFNAGFIWDDESHLTQNPCIVGPLGLKEIWTSTRAVYYPLVLTTFWGLHVGRAKSVAIPYSQCVAARGLGDLALARLA